MYYADDPFGDGHSAILLTNYNKNGFVHLFVTVGNDSIALVWTSPYISSGGGSSTPRYALFGDLDNDGLVEIIYQSNKNGIYIFEWDGVAGSYNFGTEPAQVISSTTLADVAGNCEYMEVNDIDGDGANELLVAYNGSTNEADITYIISASGEWNTGDPGFSGFTVEKEFVRTDLGAWGISGGTPYSAITAQLDGTGNKEILLHNWNHKNIVPVRVPSADTYEISDTSHGKQNIMLGGADDDVALLAGIAYDIDGDGREEVYLPTYNSPINHKGWLHMIHYEPGQSTSEIDTSNVTLLDMGSVLPTAAFGAGYGDLDGNDET